MNQETKEIFFKIGVIISLTGLIFLLLGGYLELIHLRATSALLLGIGILVMFCSVFSMVDNSPVTTQEVKNE